MLSRALLITTPGNNKETKQKSKHEGPQAFCVSSCSFSTSEEHAKNKWMIISLSNKVSDTLVRFYPHYCVRGYPKSCFHTFTADLRFFYTRLDKGACMNANVASKTNSDINPQITGIMSNWDHVCYLLHALKRQPLCPKHTECFQLCGLLCWIRVSQSYMQVSPKSNTESRLKSSLLKPTSPRWRYKSRHVKSNKSGQKNKTKKSYLTCDQQ